MNKRSIFITVALFIVAGAVGYIAQGNQKPDNSSSNTSNQQTSGRVVNYSAQNLKSFPKEVLKMSSVTSLNLSNNVLTGALPAEIRNLINLEYLNVSNNQMTGIPAEIGQLSKLKTLDYSNNKITGLPMELGNLRQLQILDLRGNEVSQSDLSSIKLKLPNTVIKL